MKVKKSWKEKMQFGKDAAVKVVKKRFADMPAGSTMVIATPEIISKMMAKIPVGTSLPIPALRQQLAKHYGATYACPVVTGICTRIAADAAYEKGLGEQKSNEKIDFASMIPFWRVIDVKSPMAKNLSFGINILIELQEQEGIVMPSIKKKKTNKIAKEEQ